MLWLGPLGNFSADMGTQQLTQREEVILTAIVEDFIHTALPVASSRVKALSQMSVSPATIRQTMAELERSGHLSHPHTSAGRVPTDKGYRAYVDDLMPTSPLETDAIALIQRWLEEVSGDVDSLLQLVSNLIARLTGSIGVALAPGNTSVRLQGINLISAEGDRVLMILETDSRKLRTVAIPTDHSMTDHQLLTVEDILRERLCGLTFEEIQATAGNRLAGTLADDIGLSGYILEHAGELFDGPPDRLLYSHGLDRILQVPDFFNHANVANLAGLIEDMDRLRILVETRSAAGKPVVTIGAEHEDDLLDMLAIIRRGYYVGRNFGTLAVLAPKRVDYAHVCAVLDYLSARMPELLRVEG